jgi:hypothetical protein
MTTHVHFQVQTHALTVVIRNPTYRIPTCDTSPLLIFSTIGVDDWRGDASRVDDVCGEPGCVRIFIDGIEVPAVRIGDAYGYDQYGADGIPFTPDDYYGSEGYDECDAYSCHHYGPTYGTDRLPGILHIFQLPDISNGRHTVRVVVKNTSGIESEATEVFIVDSEPPVITIISPSNDTIHQVSWT